MDFETVVRKNLDKLTKAIKEKIEYTEELGEDPINYSHLLITFFGDLNQVIVKYDNELKLLKEKRK